MRVGHLAVHADLVREGRAVLGHHQRHARIVPAQPGQRGLVWKASLRLPGKHQGPWTDSTVAPTRSGW